MVSLSFPGVAVAAAGDMHTQPDGVGMPPDAAQENVEYVIVPSAEPLFGDLLGLGQSLPGGCMFTNGQIERSSVRASYTCGAEQIVLQFHHPEITPRGDVRTKKFAIMVQSGTPPGGFVEAIAERVRAREAAFEWTAVSRKETPASRWTAVAAGVLGAILVVSVLCLVAAKSRRRK